MSVRPKSAIQTRILLAAVIVGGVGAVAPAHSGPAEPAGFDCGMWSTSTAAQGGDRVDTQTGRVTAGPFVVPGAESVTLSCTISVGDDIVGNQTAPYEVTVTASVSGETAASQAPINYDVPADTPVFLCSAVTWTGMDGVERSFDFAPAGPGGECAEVTSVGGVQAQGSSSHHKSKEPKRRGPGEPCSDCGPVCPPDCPEPPCPAHALHADVRPLAGGPGNGVGHQRWTASARAYVTDADCPLVVTVRVTLRDVSDFGPEPAPAVRSVTEGDRDATATVEMDVPYVGRQTSRVEVAAEAFNNDGSGAPYCRQTDVYQVVWTPTGPQFTATPDTDGNCQS